MSISVRFVKPPRRTKLCCVAVVLLGCGVLAVFARGHWFGLRLPPGISADDYQREARDFRQLQRREPGPADVCFRLGMRHTDSKNWETAAACFAAVPRDDPRYGQPARFMRAQVLLQMDRLVESESLFWSFLDGEARSPSVWVTAEDRVHAKHFLSLILGLELRVEERRALLQSMVEKGEADLFDTLAACYLTLMEWNQPFSVRRIEAALRADPQDTRLRTILAQYRLGQGRTDEAQALVSGCREQAPGDLRVLADWLAVQYELADWDALGDGVAQLGPPKPEDPWLLLRLRGQWLLHEDRYQTAYDCFDCVLAKNPADAESHLGLARACLALNRPKEQEQHLAAARALGRIQHRLGWATAVEPSPVVLAEIAEFSWNIGLRQECRTIVDAGLRAFPQCSELQTLQMKWADESPEVAPK